MVLRPCYIINIQIIDAPENDTDSVKVRNNNNSVLIIIITVLMPRYAAAAADVVENCAADWSRCTLARQVPVAH